jgi:hypothetical protein
MKINAYLLLAFLALAAASAQWYDCAFSNPMWLNREGNVLLEHHVNCEDNVFTMRVSYLDGDDSWVGIGVNLRDDDRQMAPPHAVIGDANRGVRRYFLGSNARDGSGVSALDDVYSHLKSATFFQDGGMSILEFTHDSVTLRDETGEFYFGVGKESTWFWAVGLPGNQWHGKHQINGYFRDLTLFESFSTIANSPTFMSSESQTVTPTDNFTDVGDAFMEPDDGIGGSGDDISDRYSSLGVEVSNLNDTVREQKLLEDSGCRTASS